jgi:acetyl-CoA synthetase
VTTGEPWNSGPYDWLDEHVCGKGRIPIVNCSGGTEVGACFLSVTMLRPTKACSVGFPALGEVMDVFDDQGRSVRGSVGELVCKQPWPGMTRGIWRDPERYLDTTWRRFPGVWPHGDWASVDEDGYWFLHGTGSDDHPEHRRQTDRACRARVRRGGPSGDRRGSRRSECRTR